MDMKDDIWACIVIEGVRGALIVGDGWDGGIKRQERQWSGRCRRKRVY